LSTDNIIVSAFLHLNLTKKSNNWQVFVPGNIIYLYSAWAYFLDHPVH